MPVRDVVAAGKARSDADRRGDRNDGKWSLGMAEASIQKQTRGPVAGERALTDIRLNRDGAAPVRVVLRPIGHPLPLGFVGLAAATVVMSGLQLGWFQTSETPSVALLLIAFVFPVQLIASVFGYLSRDTVAGTSMGILAGTWLAFGLVLRDSVPGST